MMTVDINNQAARLMEKMGRKEGREPTQILRRAVALYSYLSKECNGTGNLIAVVDPNGKVLKSLNWN